MKTSRFAANAIRKTLSYSCHWLFKCPGLYRSSRPILEAGDISDLKRLTIPTAADFHRLYDNLEKNAICAAGDDLCLIGDCDSGTLAFCVAFLGMSDTLISLITEPDYIHAMTDIGIRLCIEQAKFHIDNGVRVLRYNDSVANMNVISPQMWREFVGRTRRGSPG